MEIDKVIVFDIWGRYAHFKKIYVTTSALSYGVPFKTSIYGLVGALIGLDNNANEYLGHFNESNCKIGIKLINPVKLQRINVNLSDKPGPIGGNRKPTMMEFVTDPHYRVFFSHSNDELKTKLISHLENKTSIYTPVLGLAHCIANFRLIGIGDVVANKGNALIDSVIPKSKLIEFDQSYWIQDEIHIQEQDMYPLEMNTQREVIKRDSILFDLNGKSIKVKVQEYFEVELNNETYRVMLM